MLFSEWLKIRNENWYGVYCGPGPKLKSSCDTLRSGDQLPNPVDPLDAACKKHDINYCKAGKDWRAALPLSLFRNSDTMQADNEFSDEIKKLIKSKQLNPYAQRLARLIRLYFAKRDTV